MNMEEAIKWLIRGQAKTKFTNGAERKFNERQTAIARKVVEEQKLLEDAKKQQQSEKERQAYERDQAIKANAIFAYGVKDVEASAYQPFAASAIGPEWITYDFKPRGTGTTDALSKMYELNEKIRQLEQQLEKQKENDMVLEPQQERLNNERKFKIREDSS